MRRLALAVSLVVFAAACGGTEDGPRPGAGATSSTANADGSWKLVSGRGPMGPIRLVRGHPVTLELEGKEMSGLAACNQYGGKVTIDGSAFSSGRLITTEIGCEPAIARAEQRYYAALPSADTIEVRATTLTMTGPDTVLEFRRMPLE